MGLASPWTQPSRAGASALGKSVHPLILLLAREKTRPFFHPQEARGNIYGTTR